MLTALARVDIEAARLWADHPPRITDPHKRGILQRAGGIERVPRGSLSISRWRGRLEQIAPIGPEIALVASSGMFDYADAGADVWHVNFADPELFAFYGGPAFAQDEIQVAEHPILASVREWGLGGGPIQPLTVDREGPSPVLVRGAERFCAIDTDPDAAAPYGIYGRALRKASEHALDQAVAKVEATAPSHIVAMAAPQSRGPYRREQIEDVLLTATVGFAAARAESTHAERVRIHTGHWGTGAFGGDRVLMAAAQILAARIAGVHELLYHSLDDRAAQAFEKGRALAAAIPVGTSAPEVIDGLYSRGFFWGSSDGN